MRNEIVQELISVGDKLKIEYHSSDIDFDLIIKNLLLLLKGERVSIALIFKNGNIQKQIIPRSQLKPYFEMMKSDPLALAKVAPEGERFPTSVACDRISFKFQGFEEPYIYVEVEQ